MDTNPASQNQPTQPEPVQPVPSQSTSGQSSNGAGFAIAALVLGIIAFVFGWLGVFNILTAVLAIVFSILAMKKNQSKGMWIAGLILGTLGLLFSLWVTFVLGAALIEGVKEFEINSSQESTQSETGISETEI